MNQNEFLDNFRSQFVDCDEIEVNSSTNFRNLGSWDSLTGMAVLVMIQDNYGVEMADTELKKCSTIDDVFKYVSLKQ